MSRRLISSMIDDEGGNRLGGSGTEVRVYDDEALTTLSTLYRRATGAGAQPNPLTPNAGVQTTLTVQAEAAHTSITVANVTGFAVGDLIPIYDGTNTVYRVITAIDGGTKVITLDSALGFQFLVANTLVGNADMVGHVWAWVEATQEYYVQVKDVASGRVMPPLVLPTQPGLIDFYDEGTLTATRSKLNVTGVRATLTDDAGNGRAVIDVPNPMTAVGDMIRGGASGAETRLAIGTNAGDLLRVSGGIPAWLARGSALQILHVNAGGTDIEWAAPSISIDWQLFTGSGTWTKHTRVIAWGGGGQSGGAASGGTATNTRGGAGAAPGWRVVADFDPADLGATETVTIGAGGTGAGQGGDNAAGTAGADGGSTTFGAHLTARGGKGGNPGLQAGGQALGVDNSSQVGTKSTTDGTLGPKGGDSDTAASATAGGSAPLSPGAGGAGGSHNSSDVARAPSAGGKSDAITDGSGGAAGANGNPPTAGTAGTSRSGTGRSGDGGGGGGARTTATGNGAIGGAGGIPGGAGGGGGAGRGGAGNVGGAGGDGARGEMIVVTWG